MAKSNHQPQSQHALEPVFQQIGEDIGTITRNTSQSNELLTQILHRLENGSAPAPKPLPAKPKEKPLSAAAKWLEETINSGKLLTVYRFKTPAATAEDINNSRYATINIPAHLVGKKGILRRSFTNDEWDVELVESFNASYDASPYSGSPANTRSVVEFITAEDATEANIASAVEVPFNAVETTSDEEE